MSHQGDAAEQIVDMAANITLKGLEFATNLAGKGALALATFLLAVLKDQKRVSGKARIKAFQGKPTQVFVMKNNELEKFAKEAKKYGILYAAIINKKDKNGLCDIIINANDAARVSRIAEKFKLSTVDIDKIKAEIEQTRASKKADEKHTVDDSALDEMLNSEQPSEEPSNPMKAGTEKSNPFVPISKAKSNSERVSEKPSVKKEIAQIKENRKNNTQKQNTRQMPVKSKPKVKGR